MPPIPTREPVLGTRDLQLDWDTAGVRAGWRDRLDHRYLIGRLLRLTADVVLRGKPRRALDVAAAEGIQTADLALAGVAAVAIDPSPAMLARAREVMTERAARFALVRGIAETMPFRDGAFDGVLCHGAIDQVADPALAVREMARILTPDGRLVISGLNYEGLSVRVSRSLYRIGRALEVIPTSPPAPARYWDPPVPAEHSFEFSYRTIHALCTPYLELDHALGVSLGAGVPGWGAILGLLPRSASLRMLRAFDALAARVPYAADFLYMVWKPRPRSLWPVRRPPAEGGYVVQPDDLTYPYKAQRERRYWAMSHYSHRPLPADAVEQRAVNRALTGAPDRSWLDDLIARGPFGDAAVLGCDEVRYDRVWLERGASRSLDVYELSADAIAAVRRQLGPLASWARFIETDLNFVELPEARYDVVWSSGCLHHIVNLEHLLVQIERTLRPGGLFAVHDYVGERRFQYSPARLARIAEVLREVPTRWRCGGIERIEAPEPESLSVFCGMRPGALLPIAAERLDLVHEGRYGALFPLALKIDLAGIARTDPALLERLEQAEREASNDPATPPSGVYAVFRKRESP
jgi:SAM-dependent methyltransferase